jgi:hypothetical protein
MFNATKGNIIMNNQVEVHINFYESLRDFAFAEPYAVLSNSEVSSLLKRFDRWISTIATHPNLVDMLGDSIIAHIKMATALRVAVKEARQAGIFPNVIYSPNDYRETMNFLAETRAHREPCSNVMTSTKT